MMKKENNKEELILDLLEVQAYRELQSEPFEFGGEVVTNDSEVSEDAYYRMEEQAIIQRLKDLKPGQLSVRKKETNLHTRAWLGKRKLRKANSNGAYFVQEDVDNPKHLMIVHVSGCRKLAKRCTNSKIRSKKLDCIKYGGHYRKYYDYWGTVF